MEREEQAARRAAPAGLDFWSVRLVHEESQRLRVRNDVGEPPERSAGTGAMVQATRGGGQGFAATADLSEAGLRRAFEQASSLADATARYSVFDHRLAPVPQASGEYVSPHAQPAAALSLADRYALLAESCANAKVADVIVDRTAYLWTTQTEQLLLASTGARIAQRTAITLPSLMVVAAEGGDTQARSIGGQYGGICRQGGLEVLHAWGLLTQAARVAHEAIELVRAPNCPSGEMDLILMPDQMMLQIHESIGHPLELDRILGDERNFAGTSFVTLDMFGSYRWGSELLNVSFAPDEPGEVASFAFDDEGTPARREWIIRHGILQRPLGGALSQARVAGTRAPLPGVATTRACAWNRPPIDRMSNLNVEPGTASLEDMVASTELGIVMRTNASWSIDDSRNKFQFGCEHGQMVRNGKLAEVVKRPNYRGISSHFWRSLAMVGNRDSYEVLGTPFCGKGEPSQVVRVGHASPPCKFSQVSVFGGA